ncbi:hypothetical protein TNCV_2174101 [Trichonephila clavipes]|nr:hypothetical protein TNCV_2174101 [Trichonephila clavipes]
MVNSPNIAASAKLATDLAPNVGDKLGDHGNPAPNNPVWQPYRVFSSIVREFLELFYNLWRTVLAKNKIVLDPALRLQSFRTPKTQQLVSEVGLNANNKSDGGPVPDSSRKIDRQHECQYGRNEIGLDRQHECQHGRNEIGVDRQHECQYGRNEIGLDRQYRRSEYQAY